MPPQYPSGIKPDLTMLLCYIPNMVFTLILDDPPKGGDANKRNESRAAGGEKLCDPVYSVRGTTCNILK